jgi:hypothetical protein
MNQHCILYRRAGVYYCQDNQTRRQTRVCFQNAIDVNKSGQVERVALRRVAPPPVVGRNG